MIPQHCGNLIDSLYNNLLVGCYRSARQTGGSIGRGGCVQWPLLSPVGQTQGRRWQPHQTLHCGEEWRRQGYLGGGMHHRGSGDWRDGTEGGTSLPVPGQSCKRPGGQWPTCGWWRNHCQRSLGWVTYTKFTCISVQRMLIYILYLYLVSKLLCDMKLHEVR